MYFYMILLTSLTTQQLWHGLSCFPLSTTAGPARPPRNWKSSAYLSSASESFTKGTLGGETSGLRTFKYRGTGLFGDLNGNTCWEHLGTVNDLFVHYVLEILLNRIFSCIFGDNWYLLDMPSSSVQKMPLSAVRMRQLRIGFDGRSAKMPLFISCPDSVNHLRCPMGSWFFVHSKDFSFIQGHGQ